MNNQYYISRDIRKINFFLKPITFLISLKTPISTSKYCYSQSEENLLNLSIKCWKEISNAIEYVASNRKCTHERKKKKKKGKNGGENLKFHWVAQPEFHPLFIIILVSSLFYDQTLGYH